MQLHNDANMDSSRAQLLDQLINKTASSNCFIHIGAEIAQIAGSDVSSASRWEDSIENCESYTGSWLKSPSPWLQGVLEAAEADEANAEDSDTSEVEQASAASTIQRDGSAVKCQEVERSNQVPDSTELQRLDSTKVHALDSTKVHVSGLTKVQASDLAIVHALNSTNVQASDSTNLRIQRTYKLRIQRTYKLRIQRTYKLRIQRTYKLRIQRTYKLRIQRTYKLRIQRTHKLRIQRTYKLRIQRTHKLRIQRTYKLRIQRTLRIQRFGFNERTSFGFNERTSFGFNERTSFGFNERTSFGFNERTSFGFNERTSFGFNEHSTNVTAKLAKSSYSKQYRLTCETSCRRCESTPTSSSKQSAERFLRQRFAALAKKSSLANCWNSNVASGQANCSNIDDGSQYKEWDTPSVSHLTGDTTSTIKTLEPDENRDDAQSLRHSADNEGSDSVLLVRVGSEGATAAVTTAAESGSEQKTASDEGAWEALDLSESQKQSRSWEDPAAPSGSRSLCSADKPILILNLPSTFLDGQLQYYPTGSMVDSISDRLQPHSHQLLLYNQPQPYSRHTSKSSIGTMTPRKPVVGSSAGSDISHLALDCRDLANYHDMQHSGMLSALCRWCLRRVFRSDWSRDCYLCDLPLTHSCLMCFCALHAPPDHESTRSYNAVVCSTMRTSCGHVYHRHCWTRWEEELSPCCPKCNTANIAKNVKETFIIEKRCK
uniref:RING-type domain-containing protein n=1 Tax=Macrostomum lignano TaxID=282301 RepID=A0A1I8GC59_9PLAT